VTGSLTDQGISRSLYGLRELQSRAVLRRHCVGDGAPVTFGRGVPKKSAATVLSSNFSNDHCLVIENCEKISAQQQWHWRRADKLSAAAAVRRSTKFGGGAHKLSTAAARPAHGLLRSHGLPTRALHQVARTTTVAKLTYASPAWRGHTSAAERDRIERFLSWMKRMDYLSNDLGGTAQLVQSVEGGLMRSIIVRETHVLRLQCPSMNIRK